MMKLTYYCIYDALAEIHSNCISVFQHKTNGTRTVPSVRTEYYIKYYEIQDNEM